jgi:uncharacterized SAM-binding protein YcdF (DUF218 family)
VTGGASGTAIVIFGAAVRRDGQPSETLRRRVAAAFACGTRLGDVLYVPTGAVGRYGPSEASVMAALLQAAGVDPGRIVLEETGRDTLSSARACVRLLRARGFEGRVLAASSRYHLPRCVALLWLGGVRAGACPPPIAAPGLASRWYWRLREAAALPYDLTLAIALRIIRKF